MHSRALRGEFQELVGFICKFLALVNFRPNAYA